MVTPAKDKTILLVEDEAIIAIAEARTIEKFGYHVIIANNGEKAIELATRDCRIDLIMMDIDLGKGINGPAASLQILKHRSLPIVFLTSHAEREMVEKVRGITRYGYVIKDSGDFVLQSSIEMAFDLFDAHQDSESKMEALVQNERRLSDIIFSMADWVWEVDEKGVYTYSSPKGFEYFGPLREDVIGRTPFDFMPADEAKRISALFSEIAANKAPIKDLENWNVSRNGERICLLTNGVPILDAKGNLKGYRGVDKNITDRKQAEAALQETEERLKRFVEASFEGIGVIEEGKILEANEQLAAMLRCSVSDLIGKNVMNFVAPESHAVVQAFIRSANDNTAELLAMTADGTIFPVEVRGRAVMRHGRRVRMTVLRDITERKRAETALMHNVDQLKSLVQDMHVGVLLQGPQAEILLSNPKSLELLGLTEDQLLGKTSFDPDWNVIHEDGTPFAGPTHPVPRAIATRSSVRGIIMGVYRPVKDDRIWLLVDAEPQLNPDGSVRRVVCTFIDITDRKHTEEKATRLAAIVESSDDIIISKTLDGIITSWNKGAETVYGYNENEMIGRPISLLAIPDRPDELPKILERIRDGEHIAHFETIRRGKDGRHIYVSLAISPIRDAEGKIIGASTIGRDISGRKQLEAEREKLVLELQEALANIKTLGGLIPICASCKKIRDDQGYWNQLEKYLMEHSTARVSHGICPDCAKKLYPEYYDR